MNNRGIKNVRGKMLSKGENGRDKMEMVWLEDLVPKENMLRKIDAAVDFSKIYEMVEALYSEGNGRRA